MFKRLWNNLLFNWRKSGQVFWVALLKINFLWCSSVFFIQTPNCWFWIRCKAVNSFSKTNHLCGVCSVHCHLNGGFCIAVILGWKQPKILFLTPNCGPLTGFEEEFVFFLSHLFLPHEAGPWCLLENLFRWQTFLAYGVTLLPLWWYFTVFATESAVD